jgi:hypothetical protein
MKFLETQRVIDAISPVSTESSSPKRKRKVLPDHAYQLRKDRTSHLFASLRDRFLSSPTLRRSPRLRPRPVPVDSDPPPSVTDRGESFDDEGPDDQTMDLRLWRHRSYQRFGLDGELFVGIPFCRGFERGS